MPDHRARASQEAQKIHAAFTMGRWDLTEKQRNRVLSRLGKLREFVDNDLAALRQLAVRFALSELRISVATLGMKSAAEVTENLSAAEEGGLDAETVARLKML